MNPLIKLYKFTAGWCAPCKAMKPVVKKFLAAHPGMTVEEVDLDDPAGYALSEKYAVRAIPTMLWVDDKGRELVRVQGLADLDSLTYSHGRAALKLVAGDYGGKRKSKKKARRVVSKRGVARKILRAMDGREP